MSRSDELQGIMKFALRDEWSVEFDQVLSLHFAIVLEGHGLKFSELPKFIGDVWATTLWGCAFEDLLTRDFAPDGRNIADAYLKRSGWREDGEAKTYIKALRRSVPSLYEASSIMPGESFEARDLLRGGEPVKVTERTATRQLQQWDRLALRIVPSREGFVMAGGAIPFTREASAILMDALGKFAGAGRKKAKPPFDDATLRTAAFLFTTAWLIDTLPGAMGLRKPEIVTSDGDPVVFHKVRFPLAPGVASAAVGEKLDAIPTLAREDGLFWNWLGRGVIKPGVAGGAGKAIILSTRTGKAGIVVMGNVALADRHVELSASSSARARLGTTLLRNALGRLVRTPLTSIQTVEQAMAEPMPKPDESSSIPLEEQTRIIHAMMEEQYRANLDTPIPILGNRIPRTAVKTEKGRHMVAQWLKSIENGSARPPGSTDPMGTFDFKWMWRELGIEHLRR